MSQSRQFFWSRWTPAEVILSVLFVLAPVYYHPNIGGEGLRIPNNSTIWLVALIFIAYTLIKVVKSNTFQLPRYFLYIAAFPILVTLSGFIAGVEQPMVWLFRILFILGGLAFFFSLFQHKVRQGQWDRILLIIALSGLIHAGIGLMQIWLKVDMPYFLPKSPEGIPSGLFQQINNQATYLVTIIALSFYLASRPILFKANFFLFLLMIVVSTSGYVIGAAGSRIGLLTLFISIPILIISRRKQLVRNRLIVGSLMLSLFVGFGFGLLPSSGKAVDKTVAMQSGYSGSARLGIYDISLSLLAEEPVYGHGIGSFGRVFQHERPDFYKAHPDAKLSQKMVSHPHNELILWMVEGGVTALLGIFTVMVGVTLALRKLESSRAWAYFALMLPIALHSQVELPFYMSALHWFTFLILISLPFLPLSNGRHNGMTIYAKSLASVSVLVITIIFSIFLVHTIRSNWDFVAFYKGEQSDNPLPIAKKNPYLAYQAQWIDMSAMLYSSMQYGLRKNVEIYTEWGESNLKERPDVDLYIKLTDAYEYLANKEQYCRVSNEGLAMYPQSERLERAVTFCQY